jgi:dihydroorotase
MDVGNVTILRGGRVIDPATGTDALLDVMVRDGVIESLSPPGGMLANIPTIIDVDSCIVTPGLIDLHCHVMPGLGDFCVEADSVWVGMGVPVLIGGGMSGVAT